MEPQTLKIIVVGGVLFAIFCVVPIIMALLSHQQKMAALFAKNSLESSDLVARLELLEQKLSSLQQGTQAQEGPGPSNVSNPLEDRLRS